MLTFTVKNSSRLFIGRNLFCSVANCKENVVDPVQESFLKERCFLVDENDKIIGQANKKECHLVQKNGEIPLHRAFSLFLFNGKGHLLLQKRSPEKITYPEHYTNSCCSHPVADFPAEDEEINAIGVKRAAQRRLNYELGISIDSIPLEDFKYITRVHYKDEGNGKWGEHEIDYVLFLQKDVKLTPNPNEISEISYVPRKELDEFIPTLTGPLTPWFQLILKHRLRFWWDNLNKLDDVKDHENILRLKF
ncbi:hypothetical protein NQ317_018626 [Molorchus minor]|uniref:isopentenyl-diphosphate Delta-isomerase n=1 Tax=Molorchus minor TaxID=1323400 RepID=A0ABQ9J387_9CUCU|nr:hypothetical protein NQ317_018626 [Molorchus minor]